MTLFQAIKSARLGNDFDLVPKGIYDTSVIDPQTTFFTQNVLDSLVSNGYITLEFDVDDISVIEKINDNKSKIDVLKGVDKYTTFLTKDEYGNVSKVEIKDGDITIKITNIIRDLQGNVSSVSDILDGKTVTTVINRENDGTVISISKAVQ